MFFHRWTTVVDDELRMILVEHSAPHTNEFRFVDDAILVVVEDLDKISRRHFVVSHSVSEQPVQFVVGQQSVLIHVQFVELPRDFALTKNIADAQVKFSSYFKIS